MTKKLNNHNEVLEALVEEIDVPAHMDEKARDRYHSISEWLNRSDSVLADLKPEIYPQGSFQLGTVIKPISGNDAYDVDIVCKVDADNSKISMKELKILVGKEIQSYAVTNNFKIEPHDGRRCWTLEYADEAQFHVDILPSIPDNKRYRSILEEYQREDLLNDPEITSAAIAITDKELPQYPSISDDWPVSNPKGYSAWFDKQQQVIMEERMQSLVESKEYGSIDEVPRYRVKTPLQQAIQILKRHRDEMFDGDDDKPISIIITTLAARSYNSEEDLVTTLRSILRNMGNHIETKDGIKWIGNPVNPQENFADKWPEKPKKEENFYKWLHAAQRDFGLYMNSRYDQIPASLEERLTTNTVGKVAPRILAATVVAPEVVVKAEADAVKSSGTATQPWRP